MFPLYYAYGFTICKAQGNNHIGICTVVHLEKRKKIPQRELYVALSQSDTLDNLVIIGTFDDPWFREEEARKKKGGQTGEDKIIEGFNKLLSNRISLSWTPLYKVNDGNLVVSFFNVNSLHCHLKDVKADFSLMASDLIFFFDTRLLNGEKPQMDDQQFEDGIYMKKCKNSWRAMFIQ